MPISNPEVEAGDKTEGIIGYKKRRMSLKQGLAGVFQNSNRPQLFISAVSATGTRFIASGGVT